MFKKKKIFKKMRGSKKNDAVYKKDKKKYKNINNRTNYCWIFGIF